MLAGLGVASAIAHPIGGVLGMILFGTCVGLLQWPVLRRRIHHAERWIWATALGCTAGGLAFWATLWIVRTVLFETTSADNFEAGIWGLFTGGLVGIFVGVIGIGMAQSFLLQRQVKRRGWWMLPNTIGWIVGLAVGSFLGGSLAAGWIIGGIAAGVVTGMMAGTITVGGLLWLLE
jgi:hypothetical protein